MLTNIICRGTRKWITQIDVVQKRIAEHEQTAQNQHENAIHYDVQAFWFEESRCGTWK